MYSTTSQVGASDVYITERATPPNRTTGAVSGAATDLICDGVRPGGHRLTANRFRPCSGDVKNWQNMNSEESRVAEVALPSCETDTRGETSVRGGRVQLGGGEG